MSFKPRLTSLRGGPAPAEAGRRSKRGPSGVDPAPVRPDAVEAPDAEPAVPASGDGSSSTAAAGSDGGASNRELAHSYSLQLLGDQDLQDCPGDADPSKKPIRRLARRRQTPAAPGVGKGISTSASSSQRGGGGTIGTAKPARRRGALSSRPPADELSDEEMAEVYRFGVDPVDLGWQPRGKNPRNTAARVELWEHPATGVRVRGGRGDHGPPIVCLQRFGRAAVGVGAAG
jgi:hypothetical protein